MGSLTNIGIFDEWLFFFVHRMTIPDISENGNQDKVALIVCDMKNISYFVDDICIGIYGGKKDR